MRYLVDTNVLSEVVKPRPEPRVVAWLRKPAGLDLAISVITLGEIEYGVSRLDLGVRREELARWLSADLPQQFLGRVLPVDERVVREWARLRAEGDARGRTLAAIDGLILATAGAFRLALVTRNEKDCGGRGVEVVNPWVS